MPPRLPSRCIALVASVAVLQGTGCSWIFVTRAPELPVPPEPSAACTTSVASPVIDTIAAGLVAAMGVAFITSGTTPVSPCSPPEWCFGQDTARGLNTGLAVTGGVLLASAIPLVFSAGYGYSKTADCRQVKESQLACVSGVEAGCLTLKERNLEGASRPAGL